MDQWMLRFLLEFAKPVGEKEEVDEFGLGLTAMDMGPMTMWDLEIHGSPTTSSHAA